MREVIPAADSGSVDFVHDLDALRISYRGRVAYHDAAVDERAQRLSPGSR